MIKSKINAELNKLKSIKTESELYWIFFRLVQITSTGGLLIFLIFSVSLLFRGTLDAEMGFIMGPALIVTPVLLGCFGLYSFLNPGFQRQHLLNSPEWFKNLLTNLHLNKMEPIEAVEPAPAATK